MRPSAHTTPPAPPRRLAAVAAAVAAVALGGWTLVSWRMAVQPPARPGVVLAARASADATLASPFGAGPAVTGTVESAMPPPDPVMPRVTPPPVSKTAPAALAPPTLDAAERAEARALLAQAGVADADIARELDALLYQDTLQRLVALREAGDQGDELDALANELRAGLPAREAAGDLPPAVLAQVRALLQPGTAAASPFAGAR